MQGVHFFFDVFLLILMGVRDGEGGIDVFYTFDSDDTSIYF